MSMRLISFVIMGRTVTQLSHSTIYVKMESYIYWATNTTQKFFPNKDGPTRNNMSKFSKCE
jgi:hypothetical protein